MDKDDRSFTGLPGGGLFVVALMAAGAIFIGRSPLESSRPQLEEPPIEHRVATQDIDARLWQDPIGAVAKTQAEAVDKSSLEGDLKAHGAQRLAEMLRPVTHASGEQDSVVVLAVMLSGGPYAERAESRRRTRYAVLAGVNARGFVPRDSEHLGYFYFSEQDAAESEARPAVIPFESFESSVDSRRWPDNCKGCRLVVLWLDSSQFDNRPLAKLGKLVQRVQPPNPGADGKPAVRWRVLGPASSDGLRAIVQEAYLDPRAAEALKASDVRFFSGAATAPDAVVLRTIKGASDDTVSTFLKNHGIELLRTVGTDDRLAGSLINELELRGLRARPPNGRKVKCPEQTAEGELGGSPRDLPSTIAIVSEWDTLYGREQRRLYRYDAKTDKPGFCVTNWNYVRGIDGRLPGDAPTAASSDGRAKKDAKADGADAAGRDAYFERPEGQSQFDYLRRLASRIKEEDAELRHRYGRAYGIRAVGVLGNDVYDKLLVLQALQTAMPHAIFFTTDLDARLFHPRELAWSRNLIVASNFGLRLDDPIQRGVPPFRDSYQPSAYLSTLLALADAGRAIEDDGKGRQRWSQPQVSAWFDKPRLFEVSRSGVFDYSPPSPSGTAAGQAPMSVGGPMQLASLAPVYPTAGGWTPRCGRWRLELCASLHPDPSPMFAELSIAARFLIAGALTLALWAPALALSRGGRRRLRRFVAAGGSSAAKRTSRAVWLVAGLVALAVLPALLLAHAWPDLAKAITDDGKPLSFTDGISPWPTYAIRLATLVLCLYFVLLSWAMLTSNLDRIAREFRLGATRRLLAEQLSAEERKRGLWQRLVAMLAVRNYHERPALLGSRTGMTPAATAFWKHYIVRNRGGARLFRSMLCVLLMVALGALIASAIGDAPIAPLRGELTAGMQTWTTLPTALAIQFLIFFVADATLLCIFFMRGLRLHQSNWPQRTLQAFEQRTGVPSAYLDDFIDLEFIARRTRSIGKLIYFPFIVLSLMVLARSPFFDDWYTQPTLAVLTTISFAVVLLCAFALRRSAEASRSEAANRLRDAALRAKGTAGDSKLGAQLEALRERVENLREGAFASFTQQPLLKAALLPFLTFGGSSLFDYLVMLNF
ncbi:MAG TPA: hypothetical protein PLG77_03310 [Burkholderiaceae bacterium]|nr:hypothetical protein [Burkholderiaceae bacterium]